MPKDYYLVLGVNRGADLTHIKKAYRRIIKQYHPDISRSTESTQRFLEIREAYETLSDEEKRRSYDQDLFGAGPPLDKSETPRPVRTPSAPLEETGDRYISLMDEVFGGAIHGVFDMGRRRIHSRDLYLEAIMSSAEAREGGLFPISVVVAQPCPRCRETGCLENICCPLCWGEGRIHSERRLSLCIPPDVSHGTRIRVALDDIGVKGAYLNIRVVISPDIPAGIRF